MRTENSEQAVRIVWIPVNNQEELDTNAQASEERRGLTNSELGGRVSPIRRSCSRICNILKVATILGFVGTIVWQQVRLRQNSEQIQGLTEESDRMKRILDRLSENCDDLNFY